MFTVYFSQAMRFSTQSIKHDNDSLLVIDLDPQCSEWYSGGLTASYVIYT